MIQVKYLDIAELKEYERNARTHSEKNIETIVESIKNFGFKIPVIIDSDNVLICGHGRVQAAKILGLEKVPCVIADDLTPEQVKAFRLADNRTAELAGWDFELLTAELEDLTAFDIDITAFGFADIEQYSGDIEQFFEDKPAKQNTESKEQSENSDTADNFKCPHCGEVIEA